MNVEVPGNLSSIVERLVSEGKFQNEGEVIAEGLRLIVMREELYDDIREGLDDLEAGNRIPASDVYAEAKRRIKTIGEQ
jgi:putative addiction module CopG family antidote